MFWTIFDHGGGWLFLTLAFLAIEGAAIWTGHRTLSAQFWSGLSYSWWLEAILTLGLLLGCFVLIAHLAGSLWK